MEGLFSMRFNRIDVELQAARQRIGPSSKTGRKFFIVKITIVQTAGQEHRAFLKTTNPCSPARLLLVLANDLSKVGSTHGRPPRPSHLLPASLDHGSMQRTMPLLHARRTPGMAAPRRHPLLRGNSSSRAYRNSAGHSQSPCD